MSAAAGRDYDDNVNDDDDDRTPATPNVHDYDFDFLDKHVDHLVDHPYDDLYYYDPQHHFIVRRDVVHHLFAVHDNHVLFASAHIDVGGSFAAGGLPHTDL